MGNQCSILWIRKVNHMNEVASWRRKLKTNCMVQIFIFSWGDYIGYEKRYHVSQDRTVVAMTMRGLKCILLCISSYYSLAIWLLLFRVFCIFLKKKIVPDRRLDGASVGWAI